MDVMDLDPASRPASANNESGSDSDSTSPARKRQRTDPSTSQNNRHGQDGDDADADDDQASARCSASTSNQGGVNGQHSYANYQALLTDPIWFSGGGSTSTSNAAGAGGVNGQADESFDGDSAGAAAAQQNMDSEFEWLASSWWRPFPTEFDKPRAGFGAYLDAIGAGGAQAQLQAQEDAQEDDEEEGASEVKENPEEIFIESFTLSSPTSLPFPANSLTSDPPKFRKSAYLADVAPTHRPLLLIRYAWPAQANNNRYGGYNAYIRKEMRLRLLPATNPTTGKSWTMPEVRKLTAKEFMSLDAEDVPAPEDLLKVWHRDMQEAWDEWSRRINLVTPAVKKELGAEEDPMDVDGEQEQQSTRVVNRPMGTRAAAADAAPAPTRVRELPPLPAHLGPIDAAELGAMPADDAAALRAALRAEGYPEEYLWINGDVPRDVRLELGMPLIDDGEHEPQQAIKQEAHQDDMQVDTPADTNADAGADDDFAYDGGYPRTCPEDLLTYLINKCDSPVRTVPEVQYNQDRYGNDADAPRVDPNTRLPMFWFPVRETPWVRERAPAEQPAAAATEAKPEEEDVHWPKGATSATCQLGVLVQFRLAKDAAHVETMGDQDEHVNLLDAGEVNGEQMPAVEFGCHASRVGHPFVFSLAEAPGAHNNYGTNTTTETSWRRSLSLATLVNPTMGPFVRIVLRPDSEALNSYPPTLNDALDDQFTGMDAATPKVHPYKYRAVCYLKTKELNAAIRRGQPGVLTATRELMDMLKAMGRLVAKTEPDKFTFAVPDVAEREVDTIAPTPAGFQNDLYQYQQRSLAWLLRIENEVGARSIEVMPKEAPNRNAEVEVGNYLSMDDVGKPRVLRIGPGGVLYHLSRQEISDRDKWSPLLPFMKKMECRGAVEASKVGTGKTVVALALIMSRPFRNVAELPIPTWAPWEARQYLPSRATLVVARSDLTAQWRTEAMRFLPESARVVMLTTMVDHKKVSWNQLLLADLVIVSTAFLRNANYQKMVAALVGLPKYQYPLAQRRAALTATSADRDQRAFAFALGDFVESLRNKGRQVFGNTTGQCVMERVYWHRVIVDEAHEFCATTAGSSTSGEAHVSTLTKDQIKQAQQARGFIEALRTRFMLGLTGSPPIDTPEKVADFAQLLQVYDLPATRPAADAFLSAMSRSARPDLQLPPVLPRTIMVQMTPAELALAADAGHNVNARSMSDAEKREARLMALQHHQITDEMVHLGGENVMSVDKLTDALQTRRSGDMQALQDRDNMLQQSLQAQLRTLAHMVKRHVPMRQAAREALAGDDGFLAQLDEYLGAQVVAAAEQWAAQQAHIQAQQQAAAAAGGGGGSQGQHSQGQSQQWAAMMDYAAAAANAAAGPGAGPGAGTAGGVKKKMTKQEIIQLDQEVRAKATSIRAFHQQQIVPNQQRLDEITRQHNFMESVITLISSGEEVECNICFESTLGPGVVGMVLRCGHMYCEPCVIRLQNHQGGYGGQPLCPQCRHPIRDPIKMRWPIPQKQLDEMEKEKQREAENPGGLDYSKYGSKIKALVQYVNDTVRQDPKAKVLVFVQFRRLSDLISSAFSSLGVTNVRMAGGNVYVKRKALTAFKTDPTVKVLFLSYQDCVSGLHLTEANHVLIVHPFLARDEQTAKAYEMQGIARAVRAGQTRPVHVVRFVCEHTLEQDIHNQRSTPLTAAELEALANQEQQQQAAAANGG